LNFGGGKESLNPGGMRMSEELSDIDLLILAIGEEPSSLDEIICRYILLSHLLGLTEEGED